VQPGEALTLVARPEVIQLGGPAPSCGIAWRGIVRQRFFRGTRNVYTIEAGAQRLSVDAPPEKALAPGAEVTLGIDAEHTWAVRE
jgi:hypothetical protein